MEENKEFNAEYCKQSIYKDYEKLIAELFKLPKELNSIHYILPLLIEDLEPLQEEILYKHIDEHKSYNSYLSVTYNKRKKAFLNKKFLFIELKHLGGNYSTYESLDACFYKLYTKLTILSTDSSDMNKAGVFFPLIDNFEEIPEEAFNIMGIQGFGHQRIKSKEVAKHKEKSVKIIFEDFLKSELYNRKK